MYYAPFCFKPRASKTSKPSVDVFSPFLCFGIRDMTQVTQYNGTCLQSNLNGKRNYVSCAFLKEKNREEFYLARQRNERYLMRRYANVSLLLTSKYTRPCPTFLCCQKSPNLSLSVLTDNRVCQEKW